MMAATRAATREVQWARNLAAMTAELLVMPKADKSAGLRVDSMVGLKGVLSAVRTDPQ